MTTASTSTRAGEAGFSSGSSSRATASPTPRDPAAFYRAQSGGNLAEITDSVLYRNLSGSAYTTANAVGVFAPSSQNVLVTGTVEWQAATTSRGDQAEIRAYGSPLAAANDLRLELNDVPAGALAIFFAGTSADFDPGALGSGNLCIDVATVGRFVGGPYSVVQVNGSGIIGLDVDVTHIPTLGGFVAATPGNTFLFQGWFSDGATGANASDAVRVTFE